MAKNKVPVKQKKRIKDLTFKELGDVMVRETASILSDYIRQYVGVAHNADQPGTGVFINWDRILRTQTYQELAWYDLYDELEKDPHVFSILQSAKLNVAGTDWEVIPHAASAKHKPTERDQAIADFVKENFVNMENFTQDLYELMDALGKGFSVSEVMWKVSSDVRLEKFMNRPQRRFQFDAVTREPKLRTYENPYYGVSLPQKKFIVHRVSAKYENPFGDAIDQTIYWMWIFKRIVTKFWMTQLETATAPIPIVQHPASATDQLKDEALEIASQLRNGTYGRIPENMEILWAEAKNMMASNVSYEQFIRFCDEEMSKAVNGQTLTAEAGGSKGQGSYGLGKVHKGTQSARDVFRAKSLSATLNSTVVKWLVDFNFYGVSGYPKFRFKTDEELDRLQEATVVSTLTNAGYPVDDSYVEDRFGVTLKEVQQQDPASSGKLLGGKLSNSQSTNLLKEK